MTDKATTVDAGDNEAGKRPVAADMSAIFVDKSAPATLCYSEASVNYPSLSAAITAWLALQPLVKRDASIITTQENRQTRYVGWEIYRLWGR
jgi:hypothetical protein